MSHIAQQRGPTMKFHSQVATRLAQLPDHGWFSILFVLFSTAAILCLDCLIFGQSIPWTACHNALWGKIWSAGYGFHYLASQHPYASVLPALG